ncbi:MAG: response regulator [Deltaproteobacteria bacterium]|nr:MAG: response regulator [Deltaproteobacteria bacterium]
MIELGLVDVRDDDDVVRAHQTTRTIAAQLGFSTFEQTRIATAMSEIARNALTYAAGGSVTFGLDDHREALSIVVIDRGPGIADVAAILSGERRATATGTGGVGGVGLPGARRLMDSFAIESSTAGTRVEMSKRLPRRAAKVDAGRIGAMRFQLAGQLANDPSQEIRRLQRDIAERDHRIVELTEELTETNRGVMALHAELEDRAEYQRRAVELRTRLLSEMGHELRTPLHSLSTISQFLIDRLDGELTCEQDKQVRIIHEVAETLTAYVNDLLDLARTDAGRAVVHASRFHVDGALKALRRILQPLVPPQVALRFEVEPDLPAMTGDEQKLSQVLRNLVANAIKFTERGFVAVRARRAGADRLVFEVADSGIGIAPEHHELIFHEFAQVDGHIQPRMRGSGLGLPLSRRLAELLGGTLTVESVLGAGSTFRLELPLEIDATPAAPAAEPAPIAVPLATAAPRSGQPRILVVDDDLASRYVLKRWLTDRYIVDEAESGHDGLRLAATGPDAIFLDVVMPDLTGFEVIERLKTDPVTRDIPVVVYTALVLGVHDRSRLADAVAILRKSTSSRVADRAAIEDALVKAGVASATEDSRG